MTTAVGVRGSREMKRGGDGEEWSVLIVVGKVKVKVKVRE